MVDQLARNLDEAEGGVALEYLLHDWQNLGFDRGFPLGWRDGGGLSAPAVDVIPNDLPYFEEGQTRLLDRFQNGKFALVIGNDDSVELWGDLCPLASSWAWRGVLAARGPSDGCGCGG